MLTTTFSAGRPPAYHQIMYYRPVYSPSDSKLDYAMSDQCSCLLSRNDHPESYVITA